MTTPSVRFKISDIELAIEFVSMADGDHEVYLCLDTGKFLYFSELDDSDEPPEDFEYSDRYLAVPSKHDLDLGRNVVFDFVRSRANHLYDDVRNIFSRRGAYGQFKSLLRRHGLEDSWHEFENSKETIAIRTWCHDNGVTFDEESESRSD